MIFTLRANRSCRQNITRNTLQGASNTSNTSNIEYYIDEILKLGFLAKRELAKEAIDREEFKSKIIVFSNSKSNQVPAVMPTGDEEVRKYKGKTIKRRADGRYWTRYYDKQGKQHSVYGKTQNECLTKLKAALKEDAAGNKPLKNCTLGEWIQKWLELYKENKLKPSSLEQMHRYLKDLGSIGNKPLNKLTSIDIQEYLNGIDKPRKREKIHEYLKDALTKAVKNKLIPDNLFDGIEKVRFLRKQSKALTHEQEQRFVEACRGSNQGKLLLLCLYQGLRLGEALAITYEDIDFERKTITVNKAVDSLGNVTTPKTATSIRTLPLFSNAAALFERGASGNVFKSPRKVYQNAMLKICKELGFRGITVHSLRHTFATRCAERGITAKMVQQWLGHSTLDMTLNVYTHINADFEQKEARKFDTHFDT